MPQEADFPGLDVQKCYEILETLGDKTKQLSIDEITRLKEQFWQILESEITKINVGYTEREELCCKRFRMFDFRTFIISHHNVSNMPKTEKNNENLFWYAQYHSFCELLRDVHLLRDFTIQTFQILSVMISNLKKHIEYHQHLYPNLAEEMATIDRRFKQTCSMPLYTSPVLAKLATRTEVIATSLLCAQNSCAPQQTAFVCFHCHSLSKDMYVLRCFHRFCSQCANYLKQTNHIDCPTCGRHEALLCLEKDEPLRSFISTHFGADLLKQDDRNNQAHYAFNNYNGSGNPGNAMQPPSSMNANGVNIKPEPKDNALIPSNGMQYYNSSMPAYLIPSSQFKSEMHNNVDIDLPPMKRGRGRPRGSGRKGSVGMTPGGGHGQMNGTPGGGGSGTPGGTPGRSRVTSANSLHAARVKIKNGGRAKTSCHQCKNNKDPSELLFCKNVKWGPGKKKGNMVLKHCRKKFCAQCMGKYETIERVDELFRLQEDGGLTEWQCPACADTCECAACWRKRHPNSGANIPKPNGQPGTPQQPNQQQQQQQGTPQTPSQLSQQHTPQQSLPTTPQFSNHNGSVNVHGMSVDAGGGTANMMNGMSNAMSNMNGAMSNGMNNGMSSNMGIPAMNGMSHLNGINAMNNPMNGGGMNMSNGMMDGMNTMNSHSMNTMSNGNFNLNTMPSTV